MMSISKIIQNDLDVVRQNIAESFSEEYKLQVFTIWYNRSKPRGKTLLGLIGDDPYCGEKVSLTLLNRWINNEFATKAAMLDQEVIEQLDQTMVQNKVMVLKRHAEIGVEMQKMGMEYLKGPAGLGNARNALTMLVRGIEIERDAMSVPKFLKEMTDATDEELLEEIRKLSHGSDLIDLEATDPIE